MHILYVRTHAEMDGPSKNIMLLEFWPHLLDEQSLKKQTVCLCDLNGKTFVEALYMFYIFCLKVRSGLLGKKMRWHFSKQR